MKNKDWKDEPKFNGKNVSVIAYYQNDYQKERIEDFLKRSNVNIIWMNEINYHPSPYKICTLYRNGGRGGCSTFSLENGVGCINTPAKKEVAEFMSQSDRILIILSRMAFCSSLGISSLRVIESLEDIALSLNKRNKIPVDYLRIVHCGNYVGRVYSAKREEFE